MLNAWDDKKRDDKGIDGREYHGQDPMEAKDRHGWKKPFYSGRFRIKLLLFLFVIIIIRLFGLGVSMSV